MEEAKNNFTSEEVAKRSQATSCYFSYNNEVYDVTKFLSQVIYLFLL